MLLKEPFSILQPHSEGAILSTLSIYNWDFFSWGEVNCSQGDSSEYMAKG